MQFQKISILPPLKGLDFSGGLGPLKGQKNLKKCMKLNWKFQKGGGGGGGGLKIFSGITQFKNALVSKRSVLLIKL